MILDDSFDLKNGVYLFSEERLRYRHSAYYFYIFMFNHKLIGFSGWIRPQDVRSLSEKHENYKIRGLLTNLSLLKEVINTNPNLIIPSCWRINRVHLPGMNIDAMEHIANHMIQKKCSCGNKHKVLSLTEDSFTMTCMKPDKGKEHKKA